MLKQKEWIDVIVARTGCSKKEAKVFYDCVFDYMREQISPEEQIKIQGFGVFKLRKTAAKEQINLITGQPEIVPEHNVVTFKPYFEIDPKPEAIEVEDEDIVDEVVLPVVEEEEILEEVVEEAAPVIVEEVAEEEPVVEEEPAPVEEEPAPVVEEKPAPVVEEKPAPVEEKVEEVKPVEKPVVIEDDNYAWVLHGKACTTKAVFQLLKHRTNLPDNQIVSALNVVKNNMEKLGKTTCEIKEEEDTFDFVILK